MVYIRVNYTVGGCPHLTMGGVWMVRKLADSIGLSGLLARRDRGLFNKIFMALVGVSIVPVIACSLLFYFISRQNVEQEVSISNLETLKQTQMAVDNILEATERMSLQIVRNKEVANFMSRPIDKNRQGGTAVANTVNVAKSFSEGVQYIESISIYSFLNNMMVSTGTQRYAEMDANFLDSYGNSIKTKGFTIWIEPDDTEVFGEKSGSLQFVEFIFETFNRPEGIVQIKLKNDEFAKLINDMYIRKSGYIFVVNSKGKVILGRNRLPEAFDPAEFLSRHKVEGEGYYKIGKGEQHLLVSFTTSRYNQWKYVAVLPASEVADRTSLIGGFIAAICLFFVGLAVSLSFAASRGIYIPIAVLDMWLRGQKPARQELNLLKARKDELGRIQQEIDDKIVKLKNYFLYRLTYGGIDSRDEIQSQAGFLDIADDQTFVVLLVEADKPAAGEGSPLRPAIMDAVQKALAGSLSLVNVAGEYRDDHERTVAIAAFGAECTESVIRPVIEESVRLAQRLVSELYGATITVAVGTAQKGLENVRVSYNAANEMLKQKFIKGSGAIIFRGEQSGGPTPDPRRSFSKAQLINCLDARDERQLSKLLDGFKMNMKSRVSAKSVYVFYCKEMINGSIGYLQGLGARFAQERAELKDMFDNFEKRFDNIDMAVDAIAGCLAKVIAKLERENPELASRRAVERAVAIIAAEFDKDIGLAYVCGQIGISEPYLSKVFKEELGQNFKDYLTGIRLSRAKELLRDTDATVGAVARAVGYNNPNQFAKMFKKYEGVTPGAYRQSALSKQQVISIQGYKNGRGK